MIRNSRACRVAGWRLAAEPPYRERRWPQWPKRNPVRPGYMYSSRPESRIPRRAATTWPQL